MTLSSMLIMSTTDKFPYEEIYTTEELTRIENEFPRLKNVCYLDHAGTTLYAKSQVEAFSATLLENVFGNPHSRNPSSSLTTDAIDSIRDRILRHFGTSGDDYAIIFTSGATSGLKILAESFTFNSGPFLYMEESHTSVVGMREIVEMSGTPCGGVYAIPIDEMRKCLEAPSLPGNGLGNYYHDTNSKRESDLDEIERKGMRNGLVAFPAQCNFSGYKYPLRWIKEIRNGKLRSILSSKKYQVSAGGTSCPEQWYVLLDAAAFVGTNYLDLSTFPADFVTLSFYKMFGFPTGLGALLVRRRSGSLLKKHYVGGGTVEVLIPSTSFHVNRKELHHKFEDGTLPFLSILSLKAGFDTWLHLGVSLEKISLRTFRLAQYGFKVLASMRHGNGQPVAQIYSRTSYDSKETSGGVLTFNLLRQDGTFIGYSQVEEMAFLHGIHLRYGCFCNPGACQRFLGYDSTDLLKHFAAGHVCGDTRDLVDGKPTGAVRVSFGYMNSLADVDSLLDLIHRSWVMTEEAPRHGEVNGRSGTSQWHASGRPDLIHSEKRLLRIFLYPIKSCAPFEVTGSWWVGERGLLYDREWLIMNSMGVPLTQKREARLCLLQPTVDLSNRRLRISATGFPDVSVDLERRREPNSEEEETELCNSKVCGEKISGINCGGEVSDWLSRVLNHPGLKLIRSLPDSRRRERETGHGLSLANDSQYLLVSGGSLLQLAGDLESKGITFSSSDSSHEAEDDGGDNLIRKSAENLLRRFRPNFYVSEWIPYEEETWDQIQIGSSIFKSGGPCTRCGTVCMDQKTGHRSPEPLRILSERRAGSPKFGIHLSMEGDNDVNGSQMISIGDPVTILPGTLSHSSKTSIKKTKGVTFTTALPHTPQFLQNRILIDTID